MSHFTVLVIGEDVEKQLAPYQENNMGDCPQEFLTWVSVANDYENIQEAIDDGYKVQNGIPGYWENSNRKWDWYEIGGRWTGFFKLKDGSIADQARKGDIDFDNMKKEAAREAENRYNTLLRIFDGEIPKIEFLWKQIIDDNGNFKNWSIEDKRKFYHNQKALRSLREKQECPNLSKEDKQFITWLELEEYQVDKDTYIKNAKNQALVTFAVIKDGKWYEQGKMGWWACVTNEKENDVWIEEFNKLLNSVSDDTLLTIMDCHV